MNILIEGPDGTGKSTLAEALSTATGRPIVRSPGPPKNKQEIIERAEAALSTDGVIFDRHPIISEWVYGAFRPTGTMLPDRYMDALLKQSNFIVWCNRSMNHTIKVHDTLDHLKMVEERHDAIAARYTVLLLGRCHYIHDCRDPITETARLIKGMMR